MKSLKVEIFTHSSHLFSSIDYIISYRIAHNFHDRATRDTQLYSIRYDKNFCWEFICPIKSETVCIVTKGTHICLIIVYNLLADLNSSSIWNNKYSIAKQIAVTQIIIQTDKNNDEMLNICLIEWVLWWTIEFFVLIFGVGKLSRCDKIEHTLTLKVELFSNNRRQDMKCFDGKLFILENVNINNGKMGVAELIDREI